MSKSVVVELVCYNIASVIEASSGGADRIELCDNPAEGGTTPSVGTISLALEKSRAPVFVMIRPRGGDFCYNDEEFEVMKRDVEQARRMNAAGVVFGILQTNGKMDTGRCEKLIQMAGPMQVTCHRAFDMTRDPMEALEDCVMLNFDRILTSGQQASVPTGIPLIRELVEKAAGRIAIMPGAGIREENVGDIIRKTKAREIHISARSYSESPMAFRNPAVVMGEDPREYQRLIVSAEKIRTIRRLAEAALTKAV